MAEARAVPRVLLIYPRGPSARGMQDTLLAEDITTDLAEDVFSAVSTYAANPSDLVVLGLNSLEERDLEVVRVLREIRAEVYILLAFPAHLRDRAVKALALGADSYILEPFYLAEFLDIVCISEIVHQLLLIDTRRAIVLTRFVGVPCQD